MLTMYDHTEFFVEAIQAGASGYLLKKNNPSELVKAIRIVAGGEAYFSPKLTHELIKHQRNFSTQQQDTGYVSLSEREREVLLGVAQGLSNRELAGRMSISTSTVQSHRSNILEKLNLRNTVDLVRYAVRIGLIEP